MIRVLFFGPVVEHVDAHEMQVEFQSGMCLQELVSQMKSLYPMAFELICYTAVNDVQTRNMQLPLADNDEIAFMAKFSGG